MLAITSLLNPDPGNGEGQGMRSSTSLASPDHSPSHQHPPISSHSPSPKPPNMSPSPITTPKLQKYAKDQAIFVPGSPDGPVNFPPHEIPAKDAGLATSERSELLRQHERFQIFPRDTYGKDVISQYVRHIPYSSDKKIFGISTGRSGFEVFQYTFIVPEDKDQKKHVVIWDYQIGLVRITPFFKACDYSKTTPKKAINTNRGLEALSYSITGGALTAQGYWLPYHCARALCLTFCYNIRWVLTPIFGVSFLKECIPPSSSRFARFAIHPEYVRRAQGELEAWQAQARLKETPADASSPEKTAQTSSTTTSTDAQKKQLRSHKKRLTRGLTAVTEAEATTTAAAAAAAIAAELSPQTPSKHDVKMPPTRGAYPITKRAKTNPGPPLATSMDAGTEDPAVDPQCLVRLNLRKKFVPHPGASAPESSFETFGLSRRLYQKEMPTTPTPTPARARGMKRRFSWVDEKGGGVEGEEEEEKEEKEEKEEEEEEGKEGNSNDDATSDEDDDEDGSDETEVDDDEDDTDDEDEKASRLLLRSELVSWSPASSESDDQDIVLPSVSRGSLASQRNASASRRPLSPRAEAAASPASAHEAAELLMFANAMVSLEGSVRDYSIDPWRVPF